MGNLDFMGIPMFLFKDTLTIFMGLDWRFTALFTPLFSKMDRILITWNFRPTSIWAKIELILAGMGICTNQTDFLGYWHKLFDPYQIHRLVPEFTSKINQKRSVQRCHIGSFWAPVLSPNTWDRWFCPWPACSGTVEHSIRLTRERREDIQQRWYDFSCKHRDFTGETWLVQESFIITKHPA